jgi:hypothetical protein
MSSREARRERREEEKRERAGWYRGLCVCVCVEKKVVVLRGTARERREAHTAAVTGV